MYNWWKARILIWFCVQIDERITKFSTESNASLLLTLNRTFQWMDDRRSEEEVDTENTVTNYKSHT